MEEPTQVCGCLRCQDTRHFNASPLTTMNRQVSGFRYACEVCGNKRCPHHTDHLLPCSGSNDSGQPGSMYQ